MFRSPDIKRLGIELDVPRGLVIKVARGAAQLSGLQPGDRIAALNGQRVWTFGDFQYQYDRIPRDARHIELGLESVYWALRATPLPETKSLDKSF